MKILPKPKAPAWLQMMQLMSNPLDYLEKVGQRHGDIFTLPFFAGETVFISDPQGLKELFTNSKEITAPGELNRAAAIVSGENGILQLDGLRHQHRRKLMMSAFHGSRIQNYAQRMCELTQQVMDKQAISQPFLVYPVMEAISLQVILEVVLGLSAGENSQQLKQAIAALLNFGVSSLGETVVSTPFLQKNFGLWNPWGYFLDLKQQIANLIYAEIDKRRHHQDIDSPNLLSELISARDETGAALTNQEIHDLILAPLFAGRDAAASAVSWSLYWTHHLPRVREQLLAELDSLGEFPDPLKIAQLPYLTAVCHEALRLYPTQVFTFPRQVESPISVMGYELTPGMVLIGNIYLTHQRKDLYPTPKEFLPERFLERKFSPYEFLPFGGGIRGCIGASLVMLQMKLVLATILSNYQLALASEKPVQPQRRSINFPPTSLQMKILSQRQMQTRLVVSAEW